MAEVFADDAVLVRRIHVVMQALELVEKIAAVERMKLRQESRQRPQHLKSAMEFTKRRNPGQFLLENVARGVRRNGVTVKRFGHLGYGGHIDEKRIYGRYIFQYRKSFVGKVDVLKTIVCLVNLTPKERRDFK